MALKETVKAVAKAAKAVAQTAEEARKALGYTAKELQNISAADFNKLTNAQLKGALRTMQKATSQRKRRLEKSGVFSDALQGFEERGGIKTNLNNRVAMQAELKRAIQFMNAKGQGQANCKPAKRWGFKPTPIKKLYGIRGICFTDCKKNTRNI